MCEIRRGFTEYFFQAGSVVNSLQAMWVVEDTTVKNIVQWSLCHAPDRLLVNTAYARSSSGMDVLCKGKYLLDVMQGVDISVVHVNLVGGNSYIVDGASRVGALVQFYQGLLPMVLKYPEMPDSVVFRPYNVAEEEYKHERFRYDEDSLVEAYYQGLPAALKRSFLGANVGIVKLLNLSPEQEQQLHWQNNCMCPCSPIYDNANGEVAGFEELTTRMHSTQVQSLASLLCIIDSSMDQSRALLARREVLCFARSMVQATEPSTEDYSSISSSASESESDEERQGPQMV